MKCTLPEGFYKDVDSGDVFTYWRGIWDHVATAGGFNLGGGNYDWKSDISQKRLVRVFPQWAERPSRGSHNLDY